MPKKKKGSPNKFPFGLVAKSEFKTGAPKVKVKGAVERPADSKGRDKVKDKGKGKNKVKGIPLRSPLNKGGLRLLPPLFKGGATVRSGGDVVDVAPQKRCQAFKSC